MIRQIIQSGSKMIPTQFKLYCSSAARSKLQGKVAVITASTDGIGLAIARRLAQDGAKIVISSRKQANVSRTVQQLTSEGLTAHGVVCHVSKSEDRKNLFNEAITKFCGVDILVSNAAANPTVGPVLECEESSWDKIFDVNVKAAYLLSQEVLPHMRARGGGSIIYVSSIAGYQPFALLGAYSVSKTALLGLTKAAAQDCIKDNIRVNCLAPGIVKTKFSSAIVAGDAGEAALEQIPIKRFATPEDMSGIVSFLCSEDASYITGETIVAAGGMASRL